MILPFATICFIVFIAGHKTFTSSNVINTKCTFMYINIEYRSESKIPNYILGIHLDHNNSLIKIKMPHNLRDLTGETVECYIVDYKIKFYNPRFNIIVPTLILIFIMLVCMT